MALVASLAGSLGAVVQLVGSDRFSIQRPTTEERLALLASQLEALKGDVYSEGDPVRPMDSARVVAIEDKQKALEQALQGDVESVLTIALIRRDLDELKSSQLQEVAGLREQVGELRQTLLFLAGSLIAVLVAVIGWLIVRRQKPE